MIPDIKVCMIGDGDLREYCGKINYYDLYCNIKLLGFLDNSYKILNNSKVECMIYDWEGYGLVAIEDFSLGKLSGMYSS